MTTPDTPPVPLPSLAGADWLTAPETQAVFAALAAEGAGVRAVGGAVRNALLGAPVKDIDLATTAVPRDVMRLAARAGLDAIPTGLDHGTITVVARHVAYEVTTLRRDVETFGRRAVVGFTVDWAEDASRRDFTMNALYCDAGGTIFDPVGGYPDLAARRVRFIGDARQRIREDYLRILRFFRLFAEHGRGAPDGPSLTACVAERGGLAQLSGERLANELLRLLNAPRALDAVFAMAQGHVLEVLSAHPAPERVARLAAIESHLGRAPDAVLRLAALFVDRPEDAVRIGERLRLSRADCDRLMAVSGRRDEDAAFDPATAEAKARVALYRLGPAVFTDRGLFAWAAGDAAPDDAARRERLRLAERWPVPALPFSGRDVLALGIPAGPRVGRILQAFEHWWIGAGFPCDVAVLRQALRQAIAGTQ